MMLLDDVPVATAAATRPAAAGARLRLVGEFAVYLAGRTLSSWEVGSRKARTLLALLAVERGRLVPMDRVIDVLWDIAPRRPVENVATMVSRLRTAVGRDAVAGSRIGYRLGHEVQVDVYQAAGMVNAAEARMAGDCPRLALAAAQEALNLLQADDTALADYPGAAWAEPARGLHAGLLRRARHVAAMAALHTGAVRAAETIARAAVGADPFDETAYRTLIAAYQAEGEPARALIAYERLRVTLAHELGIEPDHATRELYMSILCSR